MRSAAFLTSIAFLLMACGPEQAEVISTTEPDRLGSLVDAMNEQLPTLLEKYAVPGAAVGVVEDGRVAWSSGYGLADIASGTPVTDEAVFQVASLSKPVTAWGIMHLVEQGQLDLDAPVEHYLTRWQVPASEFDNKGVTARRLLSHTSGLSVPGYPGFAPDMALPSVEESLQGDSGGVGAVELILKPGSTYEYAGGGYTVLQLLVEELTGETFADYMQQQVLQPLGLENSAFTWTQELRDTTATAYDGTGTPLPNYLFTEQAAAGLYATAPDLARWVAAAMEGPGGAKPGRGIIGPASLAEMYTPVLGTYGFGHDVESAPGSDLRVQHSGANRGWRSHFVALPDLRRGFVVLINSDNGAPFDSVSNFRTDAVCIWAAWTGGEGFPECPREALG